MGKDKVLPLCPERECKVIEALHLSEEYLKCIIFRDDSTQEIWASSDGGRTWVLGGEDESSTPE